MLLVSPSRRAALVIAGLPRIAVVYGSGDLFPGACKAAVDAGAKAIVNAGTGSVPGYLLDTREDIRGKGTLVIRSARVPDGFVLRNAEQPNDTYDGVAAHDLDPQKAEILAAVALTKKSDTEELRRRFGGY